MISYCIFSQLQRLILVNKYLNKCHDKTYAELPKSEKNTISHRYRALALLQQHFEKLDKQIN